MESYTKINAETIDRWVREGWKWGVPISAETFAAAKRGDWSLLLTPTKPVPKNWIGDVAGKKVLGLASGGGQQIPILAALGANCTVLDYSEAQLAGDAAVAKREGYDVRIVRADMTKPLPFDDESFDLILHPVSNCYIREVFPVFRECFRILKHSGELLSGLGNEVNYIVGDDERTIVNRMPFDPIAVPAYLEELQKEDCGVQFSHTVAEQIGAQLRAGFVLIDLYGDTNGEGYLEELQIETYLATRSRKP